MDDYTAKQQRSLSAGGLRYVMKNMEALGAMRQVADATVTVFGGDSEPCAEIWWEAESELWLVDFQIAGKRHD